MKKRDIIIIVGTIITLFVVFAISLVMKNSRKQDVNFEPVQIEQRQIEKLPTGKEKLSEPEEQAPIEEPALPTGEPLIN